MATVTPTSVKDVPRDKFIAAYAEHLKANDKLQLPAWVDIVKTSKSKELPPLDPDWYYVRAAAICLKLYGRQGLGVGRMRKLFGKSNKSKGAVPEHHCRASGGLIRHIVIQLEKCGLMEKLDDSGVRKVSAAGQRDMDLIAGSCTVTYDPKLIELTL